MVSIVMAVYNGEKYLQEQLDSIAKQTEEEWRLLIRDDGSMDRTEDIIIQFQQKVTQEIVFFRNEGIKKGAKYNFFALLDKVTQGYVMFCDQDDIWKPDKIKKTLAVMREAEEENGDKPVLVHSDLVVVDANGQTLADSFFASASLPKKATINTLLVQNHVTGCTVMLNKPLVDHMKKLPEYCQDNSIMHDYWAALYAQVFGKIYFLDETTMLYRQHGNNSIGAKDSRSLSYLFQRLKEGKKDYEKKMEASRIQVQSFCEYYKPFFESTQEFQLLEAYSMLGQKSKFARCVFYIKNGVLKNGLIRKIMQLVWG